MDEAELLQKLQTIYKEVFFCQNHLMAEAGNIETTFLSKTLRGARKMTGRVINAYHLNTSLPENIRCVWNSWAKAEITFMDPNSKTHRFKDEILQSIEWHKNDKAKYPISKNYQDHARWYRLYVEIMELPKMSPNELFVYNEELWNFYNNLAKGAIVLNEFKRTRAEEVVIRIASKSREKKRKALTKEIVTPPITKTNNPTS